MTDTSQPGARPSKTVLLTGRVQELKTWPEFFDAISDGRKTFDVRVEDNRTFEAGDLLHFKEWNPLRLEYTGREMFRYVDYLMRGGMWGIDERTVIMSLKEAGNKPPSNETDVGGNALVMAYELLASARAELPDPDFIPEEERENRVRNLGERIDAWLSVTDYDKARASSETNVHPDTTRLNWLEAKPDRFANIDRITSVNSKFNGYATLREAIDNAAALKANEPPLCVFRTGCQHPDTCKQSGLCESEFAKNVRKADAENGRA